MGVNTLRCTDWSQPNFQQSAQVEPNASQCSKHFETCPNTFAPMPCCVCDCCVKGCLQILNVRFIDVLEIFVSSHFSCLSMGEMRVDLISASGNFDEVHFAAPHFVLSSVLFQVQTNLEHFGFLLVLRHQGRLLFFLFVCPIQLHRLTKECSTSRSVCGRTSLLYVDVFRAVFRSTSFWVMRLKVTVISRWVSIHVHTPTALLQVSSLGRIALGKGVQLVKQRGEIQQQALAEYFCVVFVQISHTLPLLLSDWNRHLKIKGMPNATGNGVRSAVNEKRFFSAWLAQRNKMKLKSKRVNNLFTENYAIKLALAEWPLFVGTQQIAPKIDLCKRDPTTQSALR